LALAELIGGQAGFVSAALVAIPQIKAGALAAPAQRRALR
jgi:hypothetical protein